MDIKKLFKIFLFAYIFFWLPAHFAGAEEIKVEPKISKFNIEALFDDSKDYYSNQLIVNFKASATESQRKQILDSVMAKQLSAQTNGKFILASLPESTNLSEVAKKLLKYEQVEFVEPNYQLKNTFIPKDPSFSKQWHLKKIHASSAWDQTKGSSGVIVAVIDGGVQTNHPDLKGKFVSPYNAVTEGSSFYPDDHATHVAGIIAASFNNSGGAGVAPNIKIMPINVFTGDYADSYDVAQAIIYAADHHADIINLSLGGTYNYAMDYATQYAKAKDVLIIAAAGNDNSYKLSFPAAFDGVIGVSATDSNDEITEFSNYGGYIDLAAPGKGIFSSLSGSKYGAMNGTSMAAPVVSGVAALVLSKNPLLTSDQLEKILTKSSVDLYDRGWDDYYGYGRVDAYRALQFTTSAISNLKLSSTNFTMNGSNKTAFSFECVKGSKISLYLQNSKGTTIKKFVSYKDWSGGKFSALWDGRMDNGMYAPTGTYKIIATVSGNGENVHLSSTLKVIDKVVPSINLSESFIYSPDANGKLTIPYELNKNAKVTAHILDKNNRIVKTILNHASVSGGQRTVQWDGKDNKGIKVKDGVYSLQMSLIDANNIKGKSRKISINIDTIIPSAKITLASDLLKMNGSLLNMGKIDVSETLFLTTYIATEKGLKIRTVDTEKSIKKGAYLLTWDGKNDKSEFVAEGNYHLLVELRDSAGNIATIKSSAFALQDWNQPVIEGTPSYSYTSEGKQTFSYKLSKPGIVTIQLFKNDHLVSTLEQNVAKSQGNQSFVWDGKDQSGNVLPDGQYSYSISIVDAYKLSQTYKGIMNIALTQIEIQYPTAVQFIEDDTAEVFYKLSQQANVTIEIFDGNNKIRTVVSDKKTAKGINHFEWDGYDDNGDLFYSDELIYIIKAVHTSGKETSVTGKITDDELPIWLLDHKYTFSSSDYYSTYYTHLKLMLVVKEPIKVELFVLDAYNYLIDHKEYNLKNGTNNLVYAKSPISSVNTYDLIYTDTLGNKYFFSIEEEY
ncbi:S8 family serine peptidase [Paenisporosarcina sp.]|uniref:S8 family serine peptidase n=1 Tax=Paenisporosarcina sp. TaxID=1932001 RepID=UPI003C7407C4